MKRSGMRRLAAFAAAAALVLGLVGCGGAQSAAQGNTEPVDLSVWTYYNGDQLESFNKLVETFNDTVGKEKNITVESYSQGSVNDLEAQVMAAAQGKVGASAMPNIFMAYADTAYAMDQMGELADLAPYFTDEERADLDEAAELESIARMPARVKCAELAWRTLEKLLDQQLEKA